MECGRFDNVNVALPLCDKKRIAYLDYARIFASFLVIYGHLYTPNPDNYIRVFIYQFHMPLFFFVSGMLHKYNGQIQIRKYIKTMLVPTLFFVTLFYLVTGVLYYCDFWNYKEAVPKSIVLGDNIFYTYLGYLIYSVKGFVMGTSMLNGPCWFLIALFYCKVFMDFVVKRPLVFGCVWAILFVLMCVWVRKYFFVANFVMAFPFYYAGFKTRSLCNKLLNLKIRMVLFPISIAVLLLVMKYNGTVSSWSISFGHMPFPLRIICFYLAGFSGTLMILCLSTFFTRSNLFSFFAANSLISVLGLQVLFIFVVDNLIGFNLSYGASFLIALLIYALCLIGHSFFLKFTPVLIGK